MRAPHLNHFTRPPRPPVVGDIAQQLRDLPAEVTPPYDFAEFRRRGRERSAPKRQIVTWPHAAAAAGLTAFVAAMAMLGTSGRLGSDEATEGHSAPPAGAAVAYGNEAKPLAGANVAGGNSTSPRDAGAVSGSAAPRLIDPAEQARVAREWLARQPAEPALVRAGSRITVTGLEDRIAWFDDALTDQRLHGASPAQLKVLQQERARLVSSLAQVRYAEAVVAGGS